MSWVALPQTKDSDTIWQGLSQNCRGCFPSSPCLKLVRLRSRTHTSWIISCLRQVFCVESDRIPCVGCTWSSTMQPISQWKCSFHFKAASISQGYSQSWYSPMRNFELGMRLNFKRTFHSKFVITDTTSSNLLNVRDASRKRRGTYVTYIRWEFWNILNSDSTSRMSRVDCGVLHLGAFEAMNAIITSALWYDESPSLCTVQTKRPENVHYIRRAPEVTFHGILFLWILTTFLIMRCSLCRNYICVKIRGLPRIADIGLSSNFFYTNDTGG